MVRTYAQYKKAVKRAGGKQIATPGEYKIIKKRLRQQYGPTRKTVRTKAIEKGLRIGLTRTEINKLMRRPK